MEPVLPRIDFGDLAKDRISGYTGIVVAKTEWITGCGRVTLQAQELKDGKPVDGIACDEEMIEVIKENVFVTDKAERPALKAKALADKQKPAAAQPAPEPVQKRNGGPRPNTPKY